ncbi:Cu+-exporting ATPase [Pedobacter sp. UYP24]
MLKEKSAAIHSVCFHCGEEVIDDSYQTDLKTFCCVGCQTVYTILSKHNLSSYYSYNNVPGQTQKGNKQNLDYLDVKEISAQLVDYQDDQITIITFYIPVIHCSSCIWLLENLHELLPSVVKSRIDFLKKQVNITFKNEKTSLKNVVEILATIGYEPLISLQDVVKEKNSNSDDRDLVTKIAVAGFCFGNAMLLSFPEYFGIGNFERVYANFFGWLNLVFSIPVVLYSGGGYFISTWNNLKIGRLNLDFPLALGIAVMFFRSIYEISTQTGAGFVDTLSGLIFFLQIGKWMQQRTFHHISFERDYRSYFPVAVTTIRNGMEKSVPLAALKIGDRILVRNMEIIPADAILLKGTAEIDFSFVTGESEPITKSLGEIIYAGGRQTTGILEMEVLKPVSQSYLTQLWNNDTFLKPKNGIKTFSDTASKYFSFLLLSIAIAAGTFWLFQDSNRAMASFTAVLIIACPCALALSSPFTLAAVIGIFDKNGLYLKNNAVVEELAKIDTYVFDKTGTITSPQAASVSFIGDLTDAQRQQICDLARNSGHPLSRELTTYLNLKEKFRVDYYTEKIGRGISGMVNGNHVKLGSSAFLSLPLKNSFENTSVHVMINENYLGYFNFNQPWRKGFKNVVQRLNNQADLHLLSGDRDHDRASLIPFFTSISKMHFEQSPQNKLEYILNLQKNSGRKVLMFGDGLNDSGALKQSNLGIAITDNINNFTPGCDAVLDGKSFQKIPQFIQQAKDAVKVIHLSFAISLTYNIVGLFFAVQGLLSPLIAAILMPLSTITIILFTTLTVRLFARKNKLI